MVGSLLYLANATRPDIAFATNCLSRKVENPTSEDWRAAKRLVDYLRATLDLGLTYKGVTEEVEMYVDASFASDKEDRKSTTGFIVKFFGDTATWKSKKQGCVATSSAESEYVALAMGCKELIARSELYERVTGKIKLIPVVYEDNRSTVCLAKSKETGRLRHVDVSYHFTKSLVEEGRINLQWIYSEEQTADFLTKALKHELFIKCRRKCM